MRSLKILLLLSFLASLPALGQTFEEFKKQRQSEMDVMKQKQQEFIDRMQKDFDSYVEQQDKDFSDYLKNQWKQFETEEAEKPPEKPKPEEIPAFEEKAEREDSFGQIEAIAPTVTTEEQKKPPAITPRILKSDEETFNTGNMTFDFFGFRVILDYDQQMRVDVPAAINPSTISSFWSKLSGTNYNNLVTQLEAYKTRMNLNDWAYYKLIRSFAGSVYQGSDNGQELLTWMLLNRSGYKTRVAYANNNVSLLVPTIHSIYSLSYLSEGGMNFYVMNDLGSQDIFTYDKDYPGANRLMDFHIKNPLNLNKNLKQKSVGFTYRDKPYSFNLSYNENLINFYKDYPQVDLPVYFDAAVSAETKESLLENLKPAIMDMSETQAVGFLLKFVQTSFNYQTDQQQFRKEKFFFPEEIIYYPYSDCEDRSIFFAYLVRELLNLKVVGLEYTGHIATAVKLNDNPEGDFFMYKGEKYIVADPTFINAPLGLTMPEYKGKRAKIIEMENLANYAATSKTYWEKTMDAGGYRGNNLQDIVKDESGNTYLTGFFEGELNLGDIRLQQSSNAAARSMFVVKYNPDGKVEWAKQSDGEGTATGFSIILENNNDLYVAGSFTGKISFDKTKELQCLEDHNDVFVAKYNIAGRLIWAQKGGLDTYPQENHMIYLTKFTREGSNKGTSFFTPNEAYKNYGLQSGPMGLLYLTGSFSNTTGFALAREELVTNEAGSFDLLASLKTESDKLVDMAYEQSIAGLFSVVNHIKYSGTKITGEIAQQALNKYNPKFKSKYPTIYESIGKINFLLNDDGIVSMETVHGKSITIDKLKLGDESRIKISSYSNGDAQIDILDGISVGKIMIWFDLNYVRLYKSSGDLLFDYDDDHTQKVMNLKEDLLY